MPTKHDIISFMPVRTAKFSKHLCLRVKCCFEHDVLKALDASVAKDQALAKFKGSKSGLEF